MAEENNCDNPRFWSPESGRGLIVFAMVLFSKVAPVGGIMQTKLSRYEWVLRMIFESAILNGFLHVSNCLSGQYGGNVNNQIDS